MGGPSEAVGESVCRSRYQSASLWWPDDQAWCVATEVDFESTYIGGMRNCIEAVVKDSRLEALVIDPRQGVTWESDRINPNPLRFPQPE